MAAKEYIEREAVMEQVKAIHRAVNTSDINNSYDIGFHSATSQMQGLIAWMPAADVVEVVRCEKCKHYVANYCTRDINGRTNMFYMTPNDYCSYGERKE